MHSNTDARGNWRFTTSIELINVLTQYGMCSYDATELADELVKDASIDPTAQGVVDEMHERSHHLSRAIEHLQGRIDDLDKSISMRQGEKDLYDKGVAALNRGFGAEASGRLCFMCRQEDEDS